MTCSGAGGFHQQNGRRGFLIDTAAARAGGAAGASHRFVLDFPHQRARQTLQMVMGKPADTAVDVPEIARENCAQRTAAAKRFWSENRHFEYGQTRYVMGIKAVN